MKQYLRNLKLHHKQMWLMNERIIELKAKQKVLDEHLKIIYDSDKVQKDRLNSIYSNIYNAIDKHLFKTN